MFAANALPDVYTPQEVADAAGVAEAEVRSLLDRGDIQSLSALLPGMAGAGWDRYIPHAEAVRVVRALRAGQSVGSRDQEGLGNLLVPAAPSQRATTVPMIVSTTLHGLVVAAVL